MRFVFIQAVKRKTITTKIQKKQNKNTIIKRKHQVANWCKSVYKTTARKGNKYKA